MDEADISQRNQAHFERLALQRLRNAMDELKGESAHECEECGDPIPEGRRQAVPGCTRCIRCQEGVERLRGGR